MFDDFESLYEKYFGNFKPSEINSDNLDSFADMIEKLNEITNSFNLTDENFEPDEDELGEPNKIVFFEENGFSFQKTTWDVEGGQIVKVEIVSSPLDVVESKSNEEKLKIAIECENYEEAARLRDKINDGKK